MPRAETLAVTLADAHARPAPRVGMSNLPDGPLRRMWAKAGVVEAPVADAKPEPASEACLPPHGESPAVGAENVDPEGSHASESSDADAGAEYEREREARIARNRERMRHLGIDTLSVRVGADGDGKKPASKKQSRAKRARVETAPTRRSTRATSGRVGRGPVVDDVSEEALRALGETAAARRVRLALETRDSRESRESPRLASVGPKSPSPEETFEDSRVYSYACRERSDAEASARVSIVPKNKIGRVPNPREALIGFEEDPTVVFLDPAMKKGFYSLHAAASGSGSRGARSALAAGGDGGRVAVFALDDASEDEASDEAFDEASDELRQIRLPLQSWVAHRGWCGQVQFAPTSSGAIGERAFRVLSAGGMDGAVALWDTSRVGRESGRPLELFRDFSAHNGGIFSMHWSRGGGILTSSKDGATCVSRLADDLGTVSLNDKKVTHQTETETKRSNGVFVVERRIDDAHVGVVKCARWRMCPTLSSCGDGGDDALFATCGNDGRVCVLDVRAKRATVATLDDAHGGVAVNFLEWAAAASGPGVGSCVAENVFCTSASNDHRVLVWDLRFLTARVPLASLAGHIPRSVTKPRALYRPAFIAGGAAGVAVVTTGERSNAASLYHLNLRGASFAKNDASEGKRNEGQPNGVTSQKSPFSRGDVGFDATATSVLAARDGGGVGAGGWTLAMADRGEVRVYRSKWGDAEDVSGDA